MVDTFYNLDDINLIRDFEAESPVLRKISCRFCAIPSRKKRDWDLHQYGQVVYESNYLLRMRLDPQDNDLIHEIKQAWVSKYLPYGAVCRITLDPPVPGQKNQVCIERCEPDTTCLEPFDSDGRRCSQDSQSTQSTQPTETEKSYTELQAIGGDGETTKEKTDVMNKEQCEEEYCNQNVDGMSLP
ncbi:hypothetical protein F4810DRAFT_711706 [Camillea tinctor]|nr:hypothetical protein F4810DRAFT_711706 [Camillea tinctor]